MLGEIAGIRSFRNLRDGAEVRGIAGVEVPVASIDHLIAMKRAAASLG